MKQNKTKGKMSNSVAKYMHNIYKVRDDDGGKDGGSSVEKDILTLARNTCMRVHITIHKSDSQFEDYMIRLVLLLLLQYTSYSTSQLNQHFHLNMQFYLQIFLTLQNPFESSNSFYSNNLAYVFTVKAH